MLISPNQILRKGKLQYYNIALFTLCYIIYVTLTLYQIKMLI